MLNNVFNLSSGVLTLAAAFRTIAIVTIFLSISIANAIETTLADYASSFAEDEFNNTELTISGKSYYWIPLQYRESDYFTIRDGQYSIKVDFMSLTEAGVKDFVETYNEDCKRMFNPCNITVFGDIKLVDDMTLKLNAREIELDDLSWVFK